MSRAHFLIIFLSALSLSSLPFNHSFRPKALGLAVNKDPSTGQYVIEIHQGTPLVPVKTSLDLGGPFLWVDCANYKSSTWKPARCRSAQCNLARSRGCGQCNGPPRPGCTNNTCSLDVENKWIKATTGGSLGQDTVEMQSRTGQSGGRNVSAPNILFVCGNPTVLPGLAEGATGVAGFGRSKISLPSLLSSAFSFPNKFAICLSSYTGVIFFGGGPYKFGLPERYVGLGNSVPLILNPVSTAGFKGDPSTDYFIDVKGISIYGKAVELNTTLLRIDREGNGGTTFSPMVPYTVMESSIYSAVVKGYAAALSYAPVVRAVAPFTLCFNASNLPSTRAGWGVPGIDLVMANGELWDLFGPRSLTPVDDVGGCLAILDGGKNPRTSIVIGSYQMEERLFEFDLAQSKLRVSGYLLAGQTTCSNSNFTTHF